MCIREETKQDNKQGTEKLFVLESAVSAREVEVEYVRTKKELYLRVGGIKYKWHSGCQEYRCANRACRGRVVMKELKRYYQVVECKHQSK